MDKRWEEGTVLAYVQHMLAQKFRRTSTRGKVDRRQGTDARANVAM